MRVRRQAIAIDFLAEVVHLIFADAAFHERAGVDARRGVALEEDQVAAVFIGRGLEEVVEANVIQGGTGGEAGDVAAQIRVFQVGTHYHGQRVPAHQRANAAFHEQVARHACFVGDGNGIAVWRGDGIWQLRTTTGCQLAHTGHQVVSAVFAFFVENRLQGVQPFLGFDGIEVLHGLLQGGKATRIGGLSFLAPGLVGRRHEFLDYRIGSRRCVVLLQINRHFMLLRRNDSSKTTEKWLVASARVVGKIDTGGKSSVIKGFAAMFSTKKSVFSAIYNFCTTVCPRPCFTCLAAHHFFTPFKDRP